jgi:hypothetical protein
VRTFTIWVSHTFSAPEEGSAVVAFVISLIACVLPCVLVVPYAKRRPVGTPVTWGEAMVAAVFLFAVMFVAYGIAPHQWLAYADNELRWRSDKILFGPADVVKNVVPFTISYQAIRDIIAAGIYIVFLGVQIWLWGFWQNRGKVKPKALPVSAFGRPLLKPAKRQPEKVGV